MNDDNLLSNMPSTQQSTGVTDDNLDFDQLPTDIETRSMANLQKKVLSLPQEANDTDLIEKEWVQVLQEIVSHTSEDPYTQQNEISKLKADYMKKRYNRDVKQGE